MPSLSPSRSPRASGDLEEAGRSLAAADTHGDDHMLRLAAAPFDQGVAGEPRARHSVRMADGDRAAIDIELLGIDPELVAAIDHLHRKGLVQLPQIDVTDIESVAFEQARHREDRADAHLVRLAAGAHETLEDAERLEAALLGEPLVHEDRDRGAVRELARIAG